MKHIDFQPIKDKLEKDKHVSGWLNSYTKKSSKSTMLSGLAYLVYFSGKDMEQLKRLNPEKLGKLVTEDARIKAISNGYTKSTARTLHTSGKSFFHQTWKHRYPNSLFETDKKSHEFKSKAEYSIRKVILQDKARILLDQCESTTEKAIFAFMYQACQRPQVYPILKIRHAKEIFERDKGPYVFHLTPNLDLKVDVEYDFAVGEDAAYFIRQMVNERKEAGEQINDESPLFRSYSEKITLENGKQVMRKLSRDSMATKGISHSQIRSITRKIAEKSGQQQTTITRLGAKFNWITPRAFRANFKAQMRLGWQRNPFAANLNSDIFLDYLIGHEAPFRGAYDIFTTEFVREEYAKAEPFMSLREIPDFSEDKLQYDRMVDNIRNRAEVLRVKPTLKEIQKIDSDVTKNLDDRRKLLKVIEERLDALNIQVQLLASDETDSKVALAAWKFNQEENKTVDEKIAKLKEFRRQLEENKDKYSFLKGSLIANKEAQDIAKSESMTLEQKIEQLEKVKSDIEEGARRDQELNIQLHEKLAVLRIYTGEQYSALFKEQLRKELQRMQSRHESIDDTLPIQIRVIDDLILRHTPNSVSPSMRTSSALRHSMKSQDRLPEIIVKKFGSPQLLQKFLNANNYKVTQMSPDLTCVLEPKDGV